MFIVYKNFCSKQFLEFYDQNREIESIRKYIYVHIAKYFCGKSIIS